MFGVPNVCSYLLFKFSFFVNLRGTIKFSFSLLQSIFGFDTEGESKFRFCFKKEYFLRR